MDASPSLGAQLIYLLMSLVFLLSIGAKCWFDFDQSWDSLAYHYPFAARIVGLVAPNEFQMLPIWESCFKGFPKLGELFQGVAWKVTGRIESTNLASFAVFLALLCYSRGRLKIPFGASLVCLIAFPLVLIHLSAAYLDLIANCALAVLMMEVVLLVLKPTEGAPLTLVIAGTAASLAAGTKYLSWPFAFAFFTFACALVLYRVFKSRRHRFIPYSAIALVFFGLLSSVPLYNSFSFGNPVYPVQFPVSQFSLPYELARPPFEKGPEGSVHNRLKKWAVSVSEWNLNPKVRPGRWTIDQGEVSESSAEFRMGGFNGWWFLLNFVLFCGLTLYLRKFALFGFGLVLTISVALAPQSYELRYYMFFPIFLTLTNLLLMKTLCLLSTSISKTSLTFMAAHCLPALALVSIGQIYYSSGHRYFAPLRVDSARILQIVGVERILTRNQVAAGDHLCIVGKSPWTFVFSWVFSDRGRYSLIEAQNPNQCGESRVLTLSE